jgi:tripartite-type tricarboxylate transporter receptor subunit TctC
MRYFVILILMLVSTGVSGSNTATQSYPNRPVRIIVPYPPGGSSPDVLARGLAAQLDAQLGKNFVVDNRSGANGIIASEIVARAAPDGYTVLHTPPAFILNALVYKNLPYDVYKDYAPVTNVATSGGYVLLVAPALPARSVKELIALAKTTPLAYGSPPPGNTLHLASELFKLRAGVPLQHIPYRGGTETFTALISGQIQVLIVPTTTAVPYVKAGRLRALAFTGSSRLGLLPDVPTVVESGVPDYVVDFTWNGWFAPARTPSEIITRLYMEVRKAVQAPRMRELLDNSGFTAVANPPDEFRQFVYAETKRYAEMVREAKVQPE